MDHLKRQGEENEQYARRQCLRIQGVPSHPNETAEDCLKKVATLFKDAGVVVPEVVLDRAHRVGKPTGKSRQIIVKFGTWRNRTEVYKARKIIYQKFGYRVQADLTKTRFDLLTQVRRLCEGSTAAEFAFADINCSLCMKMRDGDIKFFSSLEGARKILGLQNA